MTTPLSQFDKPDAGQYRQKRKLFLVPNYAFPPDMTGEIQDLLERYWSEVRDHINNLERSLGSVKHVYHEMVFAEGDEGMEIVEAMNPKGHSFILAMCLSTAQLEATEDRELVEESTDWQRCISMGLMSRKVMTLAMDGYREASQKRSEHISARINETLDEEEAGVLFIREDHSIQFPEGVQVFYVAPPALDAIKRWLNDRMRAYNQAAQSQPSATNTSQEG
jgi:hypothetical protein